jgi:hypothetical protein
MGKTLILNVVLPRPIIMLRSVLLALGRSSALGREFQTG